MMQWIFIGTILGAIVTSHHDTREACEGKAVVLREKGVAGKCVEPAPAATTWSSGTTCLGVDGVARQCR